MKTILEVLRTSSRVVVFGLGLLLSQHTLFATVDVQPLNVTSSPSSVAVGASLSVSWQIRNNGTTSAASSYSQVRITTSGSSYGNPANNVGSGVATGTIAAGATINQSSSVTVPSLAPGTYYVWVIADNTSLLNQSNVNNDEAVSASFTISGGTVDVQPLNVSSSPSSVAPGASLSVSWQIRNNGTAAAASSYSQVRITTSGSSYGSPANNVGSGVATGTIAAGATINQSTSVTVPSLAPGTYYVWVIADNTSLLNQSNVNNDEAVSASFTISGGTVDVQPLNVSSSPSSVAPGASLSVSWQIRNNGTAAAASSYSQVRITTSGSSYGSPANNVGSGVATGTIAAGATINQSTSVTVPSLAPGTYYVWVIADNTSLLNQSNVNNDEAVSASFTISGGTVDVQPLNVSSSPSSVAPGASLSVSWQIRNNGTAAAASSYSQVRITTSGSSYGSPANNVGSGVATGTIAAGATINQSTSVTVPSLAPGTYYVWVIADNTSLLNQSDVNNDEAVSAPLTVPGGTVDVQPLNVSSSPSSVAPGASLSVSWQIRNNGTAAAASSYSQVRITTSGSSYGSPANNVGSGVATGTIAAGATINQSASVTVPSLASGTYYAWVIADNTSLLNQTDVNNDEAVSAPFTVTGGGGGGTDILGADFNTDARSINWSQEISSAPNFMIIKAAQGNNPNSFLPSNMSSVPAVTSTFTFGLYDYADPDEYANPSTMVTDPGNSSQVIADAQAAADSYYQIAKTYLTVGHLQPALDVEDDLNSSGTGLGEGGFNIRSSIPGAPVWTWSQIAEWIAAWTAKLQQNLQNDGGPTVAPILYMDQYHAQDLSPAMINGYLTSPVAFQLWVADTTDSPNIDPNPSIGSWPTWAIEQYEWPTTTPPGDLDALNSSLTLSSVEIQSEQSTKIISLSGNLSFGTVPVGSSPQSTLTINNNGNMTLTVSSITYPNGFSGNWSGTVAAGGSQLVTVTFSPASATPYGGTVTVNSDATGGGNTIAVSGTGSVTPTKVISLTGNLAFGNVTVGSSPQATLTINNTGSATLTVSSISYPSGFSGNWSGTVAAGGSQPVTVTFSPASATSYGGTITVNSDASGGVNTTTASGTGIIGPATPAITSPIPGSTLTSSSQTFQWSSATGVTDYFLYVGRALGTNDLYGQDEGINLSATVTGLPTDGSTLYVRLWWEISGSWQTADFTFTSGGTTVPAPSISTFNVTPSTIPAGGTVAISYTVADSGGPGLKQVELWRWSQSAGAWSVPLINPCSGTAALSSSFNDAPPSAGIYAYGLHVVDADGATKAESDYGFTLGWVTVIPLQITAFSVTPSTVTYGEAFSIGYTVSDGGGTGLKQIQLWRSQDDSTWTQIGGTVTLTGNVASGTFTDSPTVAGNYWYGIHVNDNAGNFMTESNAGVGPLEVTVARAPLTITATSQSKGYGQSLAFGSGSSQFTASGLQKGETVGSVTLAVGGNGGAATAGVGNYPITPSAAAGGTFNPANYAITYDAGSLIVSPAVLTITATGQNKMYGQALSFASGSTQFIANGLQNGEAIGSVTLAVTGNGGAPAAAAGGYTITPSAATGGTFAAANYSITYATGLLTVNPAALLVTAGPQSKIYGQTLAFGSGSALFTSSGLQNSETIGAVTLAVSGNGGAASASVAGSPYSIIPSAATGGTFAAANYAITYANGALTIGPASLTVTANNRSKTYGQAVSFAGTEFGTSGLVNGDAVASVTLNSVGATVTAAVPGSPYTIVPSAAQGIGLGNYTITYGNGILTVNPAALTITANSLTKTYGQTVNFAGTEFTPIGLVNGDAVTGVSLNSLGAAATATAVGSPYIIAPSAAAGSGLNNYAITYANGTLTVNPAALTITANNLTKTYGQTASFAGTEFTSGGLVNGDAVNSVSLNSLGATATAIAAGSPYTIMPSAAVGSGLNNYTITYANGVLTINPAALTITANNRSKTYGQTVSFAGTEFAAGGLMNGDAVNSVSLNSLGAAPTATAVGSPYIIAPSAAAGSGLNNYTITYANGVLTVNPASLTITANNRTKTYGQTVSFAGTEFAVAGLVNGDTVTSVSLNSSGAAATATALGSPYTVVPSAAAGSGLNNYTIAYANGTLTVNPASLTITANSLTKTFGQTLTFAGTEFTASGLLNGDSVTSVSLNSSGAAAIATVAGSPYVITPSAALGSGLGNYAISYINGLLTVTSGGLVVTWPNPVPIVYGTALASNQLNATASVGGNFAYVPTNGSVLDTGTNTLSAIFTPTDSTDFAETTNTVSLVVSPAPLTATAGSFIRSYGTANPPLTGTLTGVTNGDPITASYTTAANVSSSVGGYPIMPSLVDPNDRQTNYTVTLVNGTLTVLQGTPLLTWTNPAPITYGAALTSNQLNAAASAPGAFAYTPTNGTVLDAGTNMLSVIFTPTDTVDYNNVIGNVSLVVMPAPLTVTATNTNRLYGAPNPAFTGSIIGLTNGDDITATYSTTATISSPVGTYAIVPTLVDPNDRETNYVIDFIDGTLSVGNPSAPSVNFVFTSSSLLLSWPTSAAGFFLQKTTNLSDPNSWVPVSGVIVIGDQNEAIITPSGASTYFRLKQ